MINQESFYLGMALAYLAKDDVDAAINSLLPFESFRDLAKQVIDRYDSDPIEVVHRFAMDQLLYGP